MGSLINTLAMLQANQNGGSGSSGQRVFGWAPELDFKSFGDLQAMMISVFPDPTKVLTAAKLFPQGNPSPLANMLFEAFNMGNTDPFSHVEGIEELMAMMSEMQGSTSYANYSGVDDSGAIISYSGEFGEAASSSVGGKSGGGRGIG